MTIFPDLLSAGQQGVNIPTMEFAEKLKRLVGTEDQASIAARAAIPATTFSAYCTGKRRPNAILSVGLAKALNVDLLWLLDDDRDWDDLHGSHPLSSVLDELLVHEVRERYIDAALRFRAALEKLGAINWRQATDSLAAAPPNKITREVSIATIAHEEVFRQWDRLLDFSSKRDFTNIPTNHRLPDGVTLADLKLESLAALEESVYRRLDGLPGFMELIGKRFAGQASRFAKDTIDRRKSRLKQIAESSPGIGSPQKRTKSAG